MRHHRIRKERRRLVAARALSVLVLLAAAAGAAGQQPSEPPPLYGQTVVSVSYTSDGPVDAEEVGRLVSIKSGQPLTEEETGSTIRHLFATRRYSDVRIEAESMPGGVAVTVHLFRSFRVNPLKFDDGVSVSREEMRRTIPFSKWNSPSAFTMQRASVIENTRRRGSLWNCRRRRKRPSLASRWSYGSSCVIAKNRKIYSTISSAHTKS